MAFDHPSFTTSCPFHRKQILTPKPRPTIDGPKIRGLLRERDGDRCFWCNIPTTEPMPTTSLAYDIPPPFTAWATIDHRIPIVHGGTHALINLVLACYPCNQRRGQLQDPSNGKKPPDNYTGRESNRKRRHIRRWSNPRYYED